MEKFGDRIRKLNYQTYELTEDVAKNQVIRDEADQRALDAFLNGLGGNVGHETRLKQPETFRQAVQFAVHIIEADRRPKEWKEEGTENKKKVFAVTQNNAKSARENVTCFKCNKKGHVKRDCRKGSNKCYNCGIPGHFVKDCRKPKKKRPNDVNSSFNAAATSAGPALNQNATPATAS